MPRKSAALVGPGKGPRVSVKGKARLLVRGLRFDEYALVTQHHEDREIVRVFDEDGEHNLENCLGLSVAYEGGNRGFIACVLMGD